MTSPDKHAPAHAKAPEKPVEPAKPVPATDLAFTDAAGHFAEAQKTIKVA